MTSFPPNPATCNQRLADAARRDLFALLLDSVPALANVLDINPGFEGPITLELFNHGEWELEFIPGRDLICQVAFWEIKTPVPEAAINKLSSYKGQKVPFPAKKKL